MTKVMIADSIKPSLVMSSEVFKDKIPGAIVLVAATGQQALDIVANEKPDLCLVDFDLPDVDGPALVIALRKIFDGPILMTAYPDDNVQQSVLDDLYAFNDASAWIKKPVKFDELSAQIDKFLIEKRRTGRRFHTKLPMKLIAKADGRGKRAPKALGTILNISLGGACVQITSGVKMKKKQELTLSINFPSMKERAATASAKKAKAPSGPESKFKATVAWITKEGEVGLQFSKLSDAQMKELEGYLKLEAKISVA